ncbi:EamA family transporter RarD [Demequina gelatinilytica]|uniref:EamA family transporter RarD n=1 Tax=Demequina gelatinilytica TaxID=1638980 RepID=UPI00078070C3|nr:EamA family transporter RarD [Demequina gelatinilytica]
MTPTSLDRRGLTYGASAYFIWGLFPIFMAALEPAGALEIVAWRAISSLVVCLAIVAVIRGWSRVMSVVRDRTVMVRLVAASLLIAVNWGVMVYAVVTDRVASTSLGYYINPLLTVALGVVFLREHLRRLQVVAIGVAAVAVVVLAVEMGGLPWISLVLATSFGLYSFIKKAVGHRVDALTGLTVETAIQLPIAVVVLVMVAQAGDQTLFARGEPGLGVWHDVMLLGTGTWTAGALIVFAAGARRLPLNISGLLQYIAPTMTFALAVWYFHEPMPAARWAGFALVWVALVLITVDSWRARSRVKDPRAAESGAVTEPV